MFSRSPYRELERRLGHRFRNRVLVEKALTHPSYRHETPGVETDNQRLEFLGDAALGVAMASWLFRTCPDLDEGELTRRRAALTAGASLAAVGRSLGLGPFMRLGRGEVNSGGVHRDRLMEDAVEAVIGAIFLDSGQPSFQRWFERTIVPLLVSAQGHPDEDNPKGALQELCQGSGRGKPVYELEAEEGERHDRRFRVVVFVDGVPAGSGVGRTKKAAEQAAAMRALTILRESAPADQRGASNDSISTGSGEACR